MSRPSFQFYPGDWRKNANLGRCSKAARGAWIDVLCVLHDSDEYGVARYPLKELANASGCPLALMRELVDKAVLKGADSGPIDAYVYVPRSGRKDGEPVTLLPVQDGPLWYSSRMVKDEYVNTHRGAGTRFGEGKGEAPKAAPTRRQGAGPSTASSSAPAGKEKKPSASRAKRCPEAFEVTSEMRAAMQAECPGLDLDRETVGFRDWEFKDAKTDWPAAWRRWMRKAFTDRPRGAVVHLTADQRNTAAKTARYDEMTGGIASAKETQHAPAKLLG